MDEQGIQQQINSYCRSVIDIYMDAAICFYDAKYLQFPKDYDTKSKVEKYITLKMYKNTAFRISVIEMAKLFTKSDSDIYNFHKFLDKLIDGSGEFGKIYKQNKSLIDKRLYLESIKEQIALVVNLRSSLFAHQDNDEKIDALNINYDDVEFLIITTKGLLSFFLNDFFPDGCFAVEDEPTTIRHLLKNLSV
jgi:hypothetical protein